jgi:hypothetical protein
MADLISGMEHWDETGSLGPICPFLMPYFIGLENEMCRYTLDTLDSA